MPSPCPPVVPSATPSLGGRIQLHLHHDLDQLVAAAAALLDGPRPDPTTPDRVILPGAGLQSWAAIRIAAVNGLTANTRFQTLPALVTELSLGNNPDPWSSEAITWALVATLDALDPHAAELTPLLAYTARDKGTRRRVLLAQQLATTFQRASLTRPGLLATWQANPASSWQASLWCALLDALGPDHPGQRARQLAQDLRDHPDAVDLPPRLILLQVDTLPPVHADLLAAIASYREVHLFQVSPSPTLDLRIAAVSERQTQPQVLSQCVSQAPAHPLLTALGRAGREVIHLACTAGAEITVEPASSTPTCLLHTFQADLAALRVREGAASIHTFAEDDASVRVHACHGPTRQLEILRDELLRRFDADHSLEPRDVLVLCPDIRAMAPLINQVFADGDGSSKRTWLGAGFPRIPYAIAERTERADNPVADALLRILALPRARLTASELVDVLAIEPVRNRFGLHEEQVEDLRKWVTDAGVRWGWDDDHRAREHRPATPDFTWRLGLDRLLLGLAIPGEGQHLWHGLLPVDDVEGGIADEVSGLVAFVEALSGVLRSFEAPRSPKEWHALLNEVVSQFTRCRGAARWQDTTVRKAIGSLLTDGAEAVDLLDVDAVEVLLVQQLDQFRAGGSFATGRVSFAQLMPDRVVPHRIVALVGMDHDAFPRQSTAPAHDPVAATVEVGDAPSRVRDGHALLLAVLAARDALLITYTGHNAKTNTELPPSVLVGELLDTLRAGYQPSDGRPTRELLLRGHPLQPFSARSFGADHLPASPDRRAHAAAEALAGPKARPVFIDTPLPAPDPATTEIDLRSLQAFFACPARFLLQRRLNVHLEVDHATPPDLDPQSLDALQRWQIADTMLKVLMAGRSLADARAEIRAQLWLPLGVAGELELDLGVAAAVPVFEVATAQAKGRLPVARLVRGLVGSTVLQGRVGGLVGADRIVAQVGSLKPKRDMKAWIAHLMLSAFDDAFVGSTFLIGPPDKEICLHRFSPVPQEEALSCLGTLTDRYFDGERVPLPFAPGPAWDYHTAEVDPLQAAEGAWPTDFDAGHDPHVQRCLGASLPMALPASLLDADTLGFEALASSLIKPMHDHWSEHGGPF